MGAGGVALRGISKRLSGSCESSFNGIYGCCAVGSRKQASFNYYGMGAHCGDSDCCCHRLVSN